MDDEMERAYERDRDDQRRIDELRRAIDAFLRPGPPPRRARGRTLIVLAEAAALLEEDSASIVRTWD